MKLSLFLACALCSGGVVHAQDRNSNSRSRTPPARRAAPRRYGPRMPASRPAESPASRPDTAPNPGSLPPTNEPLQGVGFGTRLGSGTTATNLTNSSGGARAGAKKKKKKHRRRRHRRSHSSHR